MIVEAANFAAHYLPNLAYSKAYSLYREQGQIPTRIPRKVSEESARPDGARPMLRRAASNVPRLICMQLIQTIPAKS